MKRFASHFVILPPDNVIKSGVVEIDNNKLVSCFSLTEEVESASWFSGIIYVSAEEINLLDVRMELNKSLGKEITLFMRKYSSKVEIGDKVYLYNISNIDLNSFSILVGAKITANL